MSRFFLLLWLLLSSTFSFSQGFKNDSVKSFIDKTIELIAFNSIHTENLEAIKRDLYHKSLNLNSIDETAILTSCYTASAGEMTAVDRLCRGPKFKSL